MTTELTVSITLDSDDPRIVARFEDSLRGWLNQQPGVTAMAVADQGADQGSGAASEHVWRAARKAAFGPSLRNPFAP